eukprot:1314701-Amphidinium_carterae.1
MCLVGRKARERKSVQDTVKVMRRREALEEHGREPHGRSLQGPHGQNNETECSRKASEQDGSDWGRYNCAWRALFKSVRMLGHVSGGDGNWRKFKKRVLGHATGFKCGEDVQRQIGKMKVMGAWSNKATFIMAAAYLGSTVVVDVEGAAFRFGHADGLKHGCESGCEAAVVAIRSGHCVHVVRDGSRVDALVRSEQDRGYAGIFECAGRGTRIRTRRIMLETSFGQDIHFVPKDWSPEIVEREIAKVWGYRRNWLNWQWDNWTLSAEHSCERPVLSTPCRDRLNELTTLLEAAPLNGRRGVDPNVWTRSFGARTSRKHGITEGSLALGPQVREVNRLLRLVAPHETWLSFAVVSHHNVDWYVDRMNGEHSYVMTLNGARAFLEIDTDVSCMRRAVCTSDRVVYFDATRRHRPGLFRKGTLQALSDLGFPIGADGGVYPFAQPFDVAGITPSSVKRATDREEHDKNVRGKHARVVVGHDERDDDNDTVDYGYGSHTREVQLSPTIPWRFLDIFDAGAGEEVKAERDELSRLIQWTKGFGSGHSAKQLRMILLWKRLVACKNEGDRSKAEILIAAAMERCGMKAPESSSGDISNGNDGGKGRARSAPPGRTQEGKGRASSQPADNRKGAKGETGKGKGKGKGDGSKGSGNGDKPATFKLIAEEWPVAMPPRDTWCQDQAGVYVSENTADVVMWAAQCRFAKVPILAVTLAKPDLVNYPVHRRIGSSGSTHMWRNLRTAKYQNFTHKRLSWPKRPARALWSKDMSILLDRKALDESKAIKFTSRGKNSAKEVLDELIPAKARAHLLDVWGVREGEQGRCMFTCRVAEPKVDSFMTLSGAGAVWFDTPNDHYAGDEVSLTWLKTQDEDGKGTRPMTKAEADVVMRQNYGHLGIVRGKRDDFAIRACKELTHRIRSSLGQYSERLWRITNLPPALEVEDLKDVLAQIKWEATLMEHSKMCRRGVATWNVRSEHAPPAYAFPLSCEHQRFSMKIFDPRASWNPKEIKTPPHELGSKSWIDALKGNHIKEQTDKMTADRDDNEEDGRETWHDKPPRSNRTTPERPAKKLRHAVIDDGEEHNDDEMDDEDVEGDGDDNNKDDNGEESDCLSEEESLGFGTDTE